MDSITKIAVRSENLIFEINYKVQDLNLALLKLANETEDFHKKDFLRNEIIEMTTQLLKFQKYIDKQRISLIKVYKLFENKTVNKDELFKNAKKLERPTQNITKI